MYQASGGTYEQGKKKLTAIRFVYVDSLIAAKLMSKASGKAMDVKLEQESEKHAFFAARSNVQGDALSNTRVAQKERGPTEVETLERRIEKQYLSGTSDWIGDGVKSGYVLFALFSIKESGRRRMLRLTWGNLVCSSQLRPPRAERELQGTNVPPPVLPLQVGFDAMFNKVSLQECH